MQGAFCIFNTFPYLSISCTYQLTFTSLRAPRGHLGMAFSAPRADLEPLEGWIFLGWKLGSLGCRSIPRCLPQPGLQGSFVLSADRRIEPLIERVELAKGPSLPSNPTWTPKMILLYFPEPLCRCFRCPASQISRVVEPPWREHRPEQPRCGVSCGRFLVG